MALSKSASTKELSNLACIARIIFGPCTHTLRTVLTKHISIANLITKFGFFIHNSQIDRDRFVPLERLMIESRENYLDFEIPSLYFFLRWICDIPPHENKWGHYPKVNDRSLSANIERVYLLRAKYRTFSHGSLNDSTFEQEWENIFHIVKEIEEWIGYSTENQDAMKKQKNCYLDRDVEEILIKHLSGCDRNDEIVKFLECDMEPQKMPKPEEVKGLPEFRREPIPILYMDPLISKEGKKEFDQEPMNEPYMDPHESFTVKKAFSHGPFKEPYKDPSISMRELRAFVQEPMNESFMDPPESFTVERVFSHGPIKEPVMDPSVSMRELRALSRKRDRNPFESMGKETEFSLGPIKRPYEDPYRSMMVPKDFPPKKIEQITSETLKELFNSFKVDFPAEVPGCESFAREILEDDINRLVTAIQSLSHRIVLSSQINTIKPETPQVEACVFEVEVVYDDDGDGEEETQFCVFRKDTSLSMLFDMEEDTRIRVILIRSESIPVVLSKLIVYKNFKHAIDEKRIFLQHEYEDFDDLAKLIAYRLLSSFCASVESMVNAFTMDLQKIMIDNYDRLMTAKKIELTCLDVFNKTAYKPFGSTQLLPRSWPHKAANLIKSKLLKEKLIGEEARRKIQSACRQTVKDLKVILSGLEKFLANELQVDQKKQIEEWHRSEVIPDRSKLQEYPFIMKYIAGRRYGKKIVKVFVSQIEGIKTKECSDYCFKVSEGTEFEFVNVKKSKKPNKDDGMKSVEEKDSASYPSTSGELSKIIRENRKKIFARYSNVIAIREGGSKRGKPCIILHCLDKDLVPFGENPLPDFIGNWPCDVREDFISLAVCPETCPSTNLTFPDPGCSIGISKHKYLGSVGFLYESENYGSGFLTASHVAVKDFHKRYRKNKYLSNLQNDIVHPWSDNERANDMHVVGKVVKAFFGEHKLSNGLEEGLDLAAVMTFPRQGGIPLQVVNEDDLLKLREEKTVTVTKTGGMTGTTYGRFKTRKVAFVKMEYPPNSNQEHYLPQLYLVKDIPTESPFFEKGDSGSGVFVKGEPDKPLGIGVVVSEKYPETYVCKIDEFIKQFGLKLVSFCEVKQKTTSPNTEKG